MEEREEESKCRNREEQGEHVIEDSRFLTLRASRSMISDSVIQKMSNFRVVGGSGGGYPRCYKYKLS